MDDAVRIAFEAGLPYTGLRDFRPDDRLWAAVAPDWAVRERVVPLVVVGGRLKLAAARPDPDLRTLAGTWSGVDVVIAPADEIDRALADLAPAPVAIVAPPDPAPARRRTAVTDPASPERLGDLLVAHGATTDAHVAAALEEQVRTGGRLGDVLLARAAVDEEQLLGVLAGQLGLPVVDLRGYEPDADALELVPEVLQRALRCVPLAVDEAALYVAVADPPDPRLLTELRAIADGREPRCFLAPRAAVDDLLQAVHAERWSVMTREAIAARFPQERTDQPLGAGLVVTALLLLAASAAGLVLGPGLTGTALTVLAGLAVVLPALLALPVALAGARSRRPASTTGEHPGPLPLTTLLLALGGGAGAAVQAAGTLAAVDHPGARLEVLLLCRAEDVAGLRAARDLARRRTCRLVVVPSDVPATRGGMLAYGSLLARGDLLAVLDPGDVPAPGLLQTAGAALEAAGPRAAAAQTALAPPTGHGLLSASLAAGCAAWHELLVPGLARLGLPVPLSATGVVVRRAAVEEVASWETTGAAEGVDLGLRLHKCGFRTIATEAAIGTGGPAGGDGPRGWLRGQARWWQGALAAWLVHARHPWRTRRRMGTGGATAAGVLGLGVVVAPVVWLGLLAVAALGAAQGSGLTADLLPSLMAQAAGAAVLVACAVLLTLGVLGARRRRSPAAARAALLAPLAFTATAVAAWLGLLGLLAGLGRSGSDLERP